MIFPFSRKHAIKNPFEPVARMDREVGERGRRLLIGMQLEPGFETLSAALVVIEGNGKYLRCVQVSSHWITIPRTTQEMLANLNAQPELSLLDLNAVREDLALLQQSMVANMKREAGKYIDRLLAIAISDPGLRSRSADESRISICDAHLLAEMTGISTISEFASRDIAAGGNGRHLFALPAWLLFADRSRKIARKNRILVIIRDSIQMIYLPASDGLDVDLPNILVLDSAGIGLIKNACGPSYDETGIAALNVAGRFDKRLADSLGKSNDPELDDRFERWDEIPIADRVRTSVVFIVDRVIEQIERLTVDRSSEYEVIVDCSAGLVGTFVNQLVRKCGDNIVRNDLPMQGEPGQIFAVLTAMLGAMGIDQMPANLPWLTGARSQRILGQLTPGSPSNWRRLLCEMADFQPPAMKLRDAV